MSTLHLSVWNWYSPGVLNVPTGRATWDVETVCVSHALPAGVAS